MLIELAIQMSEQENLRSTEAYKLLTEYLGDPRHPNKDDEAKLIGAFAAIDPESLVTIFNAINWSSLSSEYKETRTGDTIYTYELMRAVRTALGGKELGSSQGAQMYRAYIEYYMNTFSPQYHQYLLNSKRK